MSESMSEARRDVFYTFCMTTRNLHCLSIFSNKLDGVTNRLFERLRSKMHLELNFQVLKVVQFSITGVAVMILYISRKLKSKVKGSSCNCM